MTANELKQVKNSYRTYYYLDKLIKINNFYFGKKILDEKWRKDIFLSQI